MRGARAARIAGGIILALTVLGAATPARAQAADDLAWVPLDGPGFLLLRVADLWQHPSTKEPRERLAKAPFDLEKVLTDNLGVGPKEIERLLLLVPRSGQATVFLLTTKQPALEKLFKAQNQAISKKKHGDRTYYEAEATSQAFYPISERLVVIGPTKGVLELLDRAGEKKADGPLSAGLKLAAQPAPLTACLNLAALSKEIKGSLPPQAEAALPLLDANPALLTLVSDADTRLRVQLTCPSSAEADKKAKSLRTTVDILAQFLPIGRVELAKQQPTTDVEKWLLKEAEAFLLDLQDACKTVKVEAQGSVIHGELRVKSGVGTLLALTVGIFTVREVKP